MITDYELEKQVQEINETIENYETWLCKQFNSDLPTLKAALSKVKENIENDPEQKSLYENESRQLQRRIEVLRDEKNNTGSSNHWGSLQLMRL